MKNLTLSLLLIFRLVACDQDAYIMGGQFARINQYPHSVYINVGCDDNFICGGSILTQIVILTAAHCFEDCRKAPGEFFDLKYGHDEVPKMKTIKGKSFSVHQSYDTKRMSNDIAVAAGQKPLTLNSGAKRVILMRSPPAVAIARTAGWGVMNIYNELSTQLKQTSQIIQTRRVCRMMGQLPSGAFCAGPIEGDDRVDQGDSGSALVADNYIQIGLVSYRISKYSLAAYTNVSYHYDWIMKVSQRLKCAKK